MPEAVRVKALGQGPEGNVTLPATGYELATYWFTDVEA